MAHPSEDHPSVLHERIEDIPFRDPKRRDPYEEGKREWTMRTGDLILQRDMAWRVAGCAMVVALASVLGVVYMATQNHIATLVVETDKLGDAVFVGEADRAMPYDERVVRSWVARWFKDARTVYVDVQAEKRLIAEVFAMTAQDSQASQKISRFYRDFQPYERASRETVAVVVNSALPISHTNWRVEWTETVVPRTGGAGVTKHWQADVVIALNPPKEMQAAMANPMGVFLQDFTWSERL